MLFDSGLFDSLIFDESASQPVVVQQEQPTGGWLTLDDRRVIAIREEDALIVKLLKTVLAGS